MNVLHRVQEEPECSSSRYQVEPGNEGLDFSRILKLDSLYQFGIRSDLGLG